jgi:hypothetical protein
MASPAANGREDEDPGKKERVGLLIELLASKNDAPEARRGAIRVPKQYDKGAQVLVYLASQQLLAEGADAFDGLIAHFDDERYSFSYHGISGDGNMRVGGVCRWIMRQTVECYISEINLITRDQDWVYLFRDGEDANLAEWWKKNRNRPLQELQLDAIEHAIRFMTTVKWETATPPYLDGGKADREEFETLRLENLKILERMKASVTALKQPYRPKVLTLQRAWMGLLPWATNNPGA